MSQNRNISFNYEKGMNEKVAPVIPFKKKLFLLLNLNAENQGCVSLLIDDVAVSSQDISEKERAEMNERGRDLIQSEFECYKTFEKTKTDRVTFLIPEGQEAFSDLKYYGSKKSNYTVIKNANSEYVVFYKGLNDFPIALYSANSSKDAQEVIHKLVKKFSDFNKNSEGFHVVEHLLLRPVQEEQFNLKIPIENKKEECSHFESVHHFSYEEIMQLMFDVVLLALERKNFIVVETEYFDQSTNKFGVVLRNENNVDLLKSDKVFETAGSAINYIEKEVLSSFIALSKDSVKVRDCKFINPIKKKQSHLKSSTYKDQNDFCNNRISLIFPNWLPRLNEPDFREMLMKSIASCLPAHIYPEVKWFDRKKMKVFETLYFTWIDQKKQLATNGFNLSMFKDYAHLTPKDEITKLYSQRIELDKTSLKIGQLLMDKKIL